MVQILSVLDPGNIENKTCVLPFKGEQDKYRNDGSTEEEETSWTSHCTHFSRQII